MVIDKPCPDCDTAGYQTLSAFDWRTSLTYDIEVGCGRCLSTGWIEEYRHDDGPPTPVEVPHRPNPHRVGGGAVPLPV